MSQLPTPPLVAVGETQTPAPLFPAMQNPEKFKLGQHSQHKHTVRYSTTDPDAPIDNVYVKRSAFVGKMPDAVFVSVMGA